ncbi:MAG: hypothetical protein KDI55_12795, partial [Anaerolineae bacterium]|nr:hypothetical protein [Anaerolineae bacterium]
MFVDQMAGYQPQPTIDLQPAFLIHRLVAVSHNDPNSCLLVSSRHGVDDGVLNKSILCVPQTGFS